MTLSDALKAYREKNKFLQKQMASIMGVSIKHYNEIENGKTAPSGKLLNKIKTKTGIHIEYLLKGDRLANLAPEEIHLVKTFRKFKLSRTDQCRCLCHFLKSDKKLH